MTDAPPPAALQAMKSRLSISLGQFSSAGAKPKNQDFHGALQPEGADLAAKGIAICIADGISTSNRGAEAAETAVKSFLTDYYCTSPAWSARNSGERVIAATNSWMHAQNRRELGPPLSEGEREQGLICTFSALVLKGRSAHLFHVGDARIARFRNGAIEALTEPHRVDLGGGETYLGRALGVNRHVEVDYRQVPLAVGDLFILSTDGIHEALSDRVITRILSENTALEEAARAMAEVALEAGGTDNLTVQLVLVEALPDGGLDDLIGGETGLPPAPMLEPGATIDEYEILRELHSGSRSHVYLARQQADRRLVALKVLSTELAQNPAAQTSLLLEEWVMRRLDHSNLLGAPPQSAARSHAYSVSDYVEGQSLHAWLLDHKAPDLATVRDFVRQLASGLYAMHRREMIHRDLRPHNVLVDGEGRLRIIDFGSVEVAGLDELAVETLDAAFAGTMQYSAPELYLGHSASPQSDLYSLGVIAYQLLTGQLPYGPRVAAARTRSEQRKLRYTPVTRHNPDVPDWMDAAIAKALSVDPAKRYAEISEFVVDLAKPNSALASPEPVPLLDRGGVRAWQFISAVLAAALIASLISH